MKELECAEERMGMRAWGCNCGDGSVGMGAWRQECFTYITNFNGTISITPAPLLDLSRLEIKTVTGEIGN